MSNFASNDNMTALFTAAGEKIGERAKIFPGTKAEWDALPLSEKIKYDYVAFAGDSQSGIVDNVPTENSENLVKSGGVFDAIKNVSDDVDDISDEIADMNNVLGAKNLLPNNAVTQVKLGITFMVNDDGSIRLTGTSTGNAYIDLPVDLTDGVTYTASGISGGSATTYQVFLQNESGGSTSKGVIYDGEFTFTKNSGQADPDNHDVHRYRIRVLPGVTVDTVIYPMIRLASITDDTYEPYAKTNHQLTQDTPGLLDNTKVNGAVNMLPYPYRDSNKVDQGVTFIDNGDGTITVNGTATGADLPAFVFINDRAGVIPAGTYKCTFEGWSGDSTIDWWYIYNRTTRQDISTPYSDTFTYNGTDVLYFRYTVRIGKTVSTTLKPMITVSSYNGDYVPYAKSNKELTEDVSDIAYESLTDYGSSEYTLTEGKMWQTKGVTFLYVAVTCTTVSPIENGNHIQIATIPSKFKKPQFNMYPTICNYRDGSSHIGAQLQVQHNGTIAIRGGEAGARYCGLFSY